MESPRLTAHFGLLVVAPGELEDLNAFGLVHDDTIVA